MTSPESEVRSASRARLIARAVSIVVTIAGLGFLAAAAYAMYRLGAPDAAAHDGADLARRGIAAAVVGAGLCIGGAALSRFARAEDPPHED